MIADDFYKTNPPRQPPAAPEPPQAQGQVFGPAFVTMAALRALPWPKAAIAAEAVMEGFPWDQTPEGFYFWETVYKRLKEIAISGKLTP